MAVLPDEDRAAVWSQFMSDASGDRDTLGAVTKAELRAAINVADDWVDTNASAFNAALPLPSRNELTAKQKARLLVYVVERRWEVT